MGNKRRYRKKRQDHFSVNMTDDQLIAAWLITFGDRPVSIFEIRRGDADAHKMWTTMNIRGLLVQNETPTYTYPGQTVHVYSLTRTLEHANS
mgnify:CR=1 FL=1